jgi:uncharacterized protein YacL (UPF0231 family)
LAPETDVILETDMRFYNHVALRQCGD